MSNLLHFKRENSLIEGATQDFRILHVATQFTNGKWELSTPLPPPVEMARFMSFEKKVSTFTPIYLWRPTALFCSLRE